MKKKILIVLASILVVCISGITLTACKHEHSFTDEKIVAPTCTERGYVLKVCDCGEEQIDESSYVDKIEHDYNNGFCIDCSSSVFDGDYEEVSVERVGKLVNSLTAENKKIDWADGYYISSKNSTTESSANNSSEREYLLDMTVTTSTLNGEVVAYAVGNEKESGDEVITEESGKAHFQDGKTYSNYVTTITRDGDSKTTESKEIYKQEFKDWIEGDVAGLGIVTDIMAVEWFFAQLTGGYYDDVFLGISESPSYIKLKIEVPEQTKDSTVKARLCWVFDKDYNIVSTLYEFYQDYIVPNHGRSVKNTTYFMAESSDSVPLVQNPDSYPYPCVDHNYEAGFCVDCGSSVMDAVYNLEYGRIEDEDYDA